MPPPDIATTAPPLREIFVWMPRGLTEGFPALVESIDGVTDIGVITSVTMHLTQSTTASGEQVDRPPPGFVIPLHGAWVDPSDIEAVFGLPPVGQDQVILGTGSAEVRRLSIGDTMTFERGATLTVGAIVPEEDMAGYEVIAVEPAHFVEERMQARALLALYDDNPVRLELEIGARKSDDALFAVRERHRSADNGGLVVRSQVVIKQAFGEFAYRPTGQMEFVIDPAWLDENIVEVNIPLLGLTKCHKRMAEILTDVMEDLVEQGLSSVIDPSAYAGCWNGRYIAGTYRLSRHAFGAAADINIFNPLHGGNGSPVNPELLERMYAAGLTSGHVWTNADPGHFEYFEDVSQE